MVPAKVNNSDGLGEDCFPKVRSWENPLGGEGVCSATLMVHGDPGTAPTPIPPQTGSLWLFAKWLLSSVWVTIPEIRISNRLEKGRCCSEMFTVTWGQRKKQNLSRYLGATFTQVWKHKWSNMIHGPCGDPPHRGLIYIYICMNYIVNSCISAYNTLLKLAKPPYLINLTLF